MAVPDIAQFSFSVEASADDATAAQSASAEAINDIMSYLRAEGIAEADIKTQYYNLYPKYRYDNEPCLGRVCPPSQPIEDGFSVTQSIAVKVRDTSTAGSLIAGVGERGATDISSISFTIDDTEALKAEARSQAVANAKTKAEALASDLGVRLGKIVSYYEDDHTAYPQYGMGGDMMMRSEAMTVPEMPVGESAVTSRVNLVFEIK